MWACIFFLRPCISHQAVCAVSTRFMKWWRYVPSKRYDSTLRTGRMSIWHLSGGLVQVTSILSQAGNWFREKIPNGYTQVPVSFTALRMISRRWQWNRRNIDIIDILFARIRTSRRYCLLRPAWYLRINDYPPLLSKVPSVFYGPSSGWTEQ
jgi:hypothetical protein